MPKTILLALFGLLSLSSVYGQTVNPYLRLIDPVAIARLDGADFGPIRTSSSVGFGWPDSDYPGYNLYAQDTGAGILTHCFLTARTPDTATGYKLIIDGKLLWSPSSWDFYQKPFGYIHAPLDTVIGEARLCDVHISYHHGFRILYKTNDWRSFYDYVWRPLPASVKLPATDLASASLEAQERQALISFNDPRQLWRGSHSRDTTATGMIGPKADCDALTFRTGGIISQLALSMGSYDTTLDSVWLDIYYDGESRPSFSAPLLALFGQNRDFREIHSLPIDFSTDSGFCMRFPVPFALGVRIALRNNASTPISFRATASYTLQPVDRTTLGYLHSEFSETNPTQYHVFHRVFHTKGRGRYVGMLMSIPNVQAIATLEGDPIFFADSNPAYRSSYEGTEDYFNGAQYFSNGNFCSPFGGTSNRSESFYRFHYLDCFDFTTSFDCDFQHGVDNDCHEHYRTLAFWYQQYFPYWTDRDTVRDGESWNIVGAGYSGGEKIGIRLGNCLLDSFATSSTGAFTRKLQVPTGLGGFQSLTVNGLLYPEKVLVTDRPTLQILTNPKPLQVQTGDTIRFTGAGYRHDDTILAMFGAGPVESRSGIDSLYHINGWFVIPNVPESNYSLTVQGRESGNATSNEIIQTRHTLFFDFEDIWDSSSSRYRTSGYLNLARYYTYDWRKNAVIFFRPDSVGSEVRLRFFLPVTDTFSGMLTWTQGYYFGNYSVRIDSEPPTNILGYAKAVYHYDSVAINRMFLSRGFHTVTFGYTDKDSSAQDTLLWADYLRLTPYESKEVSGESGGKRQDATIKAPYLYPDPADSYLCIILNDTIGNISDINISDIVIENLIGQELRHVTGKQPINGRWTIPTANLPSGFYLLKLYDGRQVRSARFRVVH